MKSCQVTGMIFLFPMNKIKILILSAVLVLPGLVFVFLKAFGSNVYNVEVFYTETKPEKVMACNSTIPHSVMTMEGKSEMLFVLGKYKWGVEGLSTHVFMKNHLNDSLKRFWECDLVVSVDTVDKKTLGVLVDKERRIRGYYNLRDREENDRLAVELKIIRDNNTNGVNGE